MPKGRGRHTTAPSQANVAPVEYSRVSDLGCHTDPILKRNSRACAKVANTMHKVGQVSYRSTRTCELGVVFVYKKGRERLLFVFGLSRDTRFFCDSFGRISCAAKGFFSNIVIGDTHSFCDVSINFACFLGVGDVAGCFHRLYLTESICPHPLLLAQVDRSEFWASRQVQADTRVWPRNGPGACISLGWPALRENVHSTRSRGRSCNPGMRGVTSHNVNVHNFGVQSFEEQAARICLSEAVAAFQEKGLTVQETDMICEDVSALEIDLDGLRFETRAKQIRCLWVRSGIAEALRRQRMKGSKFEVLLGRTWLW